MLTEEQIKHVAKLAKLEISDVEVEKFQRQLSEVLEYFNILNEVDTRGIEPTSQVTGLENVFRRDQAQLGQTQEEALSGTSSKDKGMFKVEKIIMS
mgnify:CR=1 FL=1